MRDHRRRTEIRLIALHEEGTRLAEIVHSTRQGLETNLREAERLALRLHLHRFTHFADLPAEFCTANPNVPWARLRRLHARLCPCSLSVRSKAESAGALWRFASREVPMIISALSRPAMPLVWKDEPSGNLGIGEVLGPHLSAIRRSLRAHGAVRLRVFGSVARGEADDRSDVDFLVDWRPRGPPGSTSELAADLQEIIGRRVQVFTEEATYWPIRDRVLSEATPLP